MDDTGQQDPRKTNISITALGPMAEITRVHGYMNTISMSKARKSIATVYQRTWNRLTACSAGSSPDPNGAAATASEDKRTQAAAPYRPPTASTATPSSDRTACMALIALHHPDGCPAREPGRVGPEGRRGARRGVWRPRRPSVLLSLCRSSRPRAPRGAGDPNAPADSSFEDHGRGAAWGVARRAGGRFLAGGDRRGPMPHAPAPDGSPQPPAHPSRPPPDLRRPGA